jgi:hypothetical protein
MMASVTLGLLGTIAACGSLKFVGLVIVVVFCLLLSLCCCLVMLVVGDCRSFEFFYVSPAGLTRGHRGCVLLFASNIYTGTGSSYCMSSKDNTDIHRDAISYHDESQRMHTYHMVFLVVVEIRLRATITCSSQLSTILSPRKPSSCPRW